MLLVVSAGAGRALLPSYYAIDRPMLLLLLLPAAAAAAAAAPTTHALPVFPLPCHLILYAPLALPSTPPNSTHPLLFVISSTPPVTTFETAHNVFFCFAWQVNGTLTSMNLRNNDIGDEGAKHLGSGLAVRVCVIPCFDSRFCSLSPAALIFCTLQSCKRCCFWGAL